MCGLRAPLAGRLRIQLQICFLSSEAHVAPQPAPSLLPIPVPVGIAFSPHPPEGRAYLSRWVEPEGSVAVRVDWSLWEGFALTTYASLNSRVHMEGVQE